MSDRSRSETAPRAWNPRYLAYAAAHGRTPEAMMDADTIRWPGGIMTGFTLWLRWAWQSWDDLHAHGPNHVRPAQEHAQFTAWLLVNTGANFAKTELEIGPRP